MFQIVLHRRAAHYFERLEARLQAQLRTKLEALGRDPLAMPGVKHRADSVRHGH